MILYRFQGSGNGITDLLYGTQDFVTATLHIILGEETN